MVRVWGLGLKRCFGSRVLEGRTRNCSCKDRCLVVISNLAIAIGPFELRGAAFCRMSPTWDAF